MLNPRFKVRSLITIFLFVVAVFAAFSAMGQTSKNLPNLYKVNDHLYRGGQPTEDGIQELKRMGVKTIINLRDADDRERKEEGWAKAAGIRFINVPESNWFKPKTTNIDAIIKQIDDPGNQPVFVHCKRGSDRTGTVVAIYRITHDGWTGKQANDEARKFGFGFWQIWMKDYINDYYRDYAKSHQ